MNARDLWTEYCEKACCSVETPSEIGLQQYAFCAAVIRTCAAIIMGESLRDLCNGAEELIREAHEHVAWKPIGDGRSGHLITRRDKIVIHPEEAIREYPHVLNELEQSHGTIENLNREIAELRSRKKPGPATLEFLGLLRIADPSEDDPDSFDLSISAELRDRVLKELT